MKILLKIFGILVMLAATACSSTYRTTTDDDIYFSPNNVRGGSQAAQMTDSGQVVHVVDEAETYTGVASDQGVVYEETAYGNETQSADYYYYDDEGQVIINNYYYGDYYDFSYASRIRRFHRPYASFGYYDPFFTNMYFYTYNPMYYGVSIYMGYGAAPFYYPGYFMMSPWHSSWYWHPHSRWHWGFHPSSYWMWGWRNTYWAGYHHGFYSGWYAGFHNPHNFWYFYNSHDGSNYHYGPRGSMGGTVDRSTYGRHTSGSDGQTSFAERFESRTAVDDQGNRVILADNQSESQATMQTSTRRESAADVGSTKSEGTSGLTAAEQAYQRVTEQTGEQGSATASRYAAPSAAKQTDRAEPQRYTRPQQVSPQRQNEGRSANYTMPRTYTTPSYQQPSTPQRSRPSGTAAPAGQTRPSGDQARPAQPTQRPSTQPSRTERGQPTYSPPRQQPSRTTTSPSGSTSPSRSTTSPARSTPPRSSASPSRSTPSRSSASPSRSTPSRSSASPSRSTSSRSSSPARSSSGSSRSSSSSGGRNR